MEILPYSLIVLWDITLTLMVRKKTKRKRRFLDFKRIHKPRTPIEKQHNKDCEKKTRIIANNWENSIMNEEYGLEDLEKTKSLVLVYLLKEIESINHKFSNELKIKKFIIISFFFTRLKS